MPKTYPYQHARRICGRNICAECKGALVMTLTTNADGTHNAEIVTISCAQCRSQAPKFLSKWWRENAARERARAAAAQ